MLDKANALNEIFKKKYNFFICCFGMNESQNIIVSIEQQTCILLQHVDFSEE